MKQRKIPLRRCTGCMEMKNKKELVRVVRVDIMDTDVSDTASSEGAGFLLDFTGKKSGRGAYICPKAECLEKARKQRGLERSFKQVIPADVYEQLQASIAENDES